MIARSLGQSNYKTAGFVGCSQYAVVSTCQKWFMEGQPVNWPQGHKVANLRQKGVRSAAC